MFYFKHLLSLIFGAILFFDSRFLPKYLMSQKDDCLYRQIWLISQFLASVSNMRHHTSPTARVKEPIFNRPRKSQGGSKNTVVIYTARWQASSCQEQVWKSGKTKQRLHNCSGLFLYADANKILKTIVHQKEKRK